MAKESRIFYKEDEWSIEFRTRNNHPGYKVWILHNNYEIYSLDEDGLRNRCASTNIIVPRSIVESAFSAWDYCEAGCPSSDSVANKIPAPYSVSL